MGDASVEFDEAVDGFGAAVAGAVGVEVSEEFLAPLFEGAAEAGDLGDGAGVEGRDDAFGDGASVGEPGLVVGRAQLLGALVGDLDFTCSSRAASAVWRRVRWRWVRCS